MWKSPLVRPSAEAPPPPEERPVPFVEKPNPKAVARINREMRQRMYLMGKRIMGHERNPTGVEFYVMGEIGKTFTVKIREFPACQCGDFLLSRLCKHTVFVWSRVLKVNQNDPLIWQRALLPSEVKRVILNPAVTPPKPKSKFKRLKESFSFGYGPHDILQHEAVYCPVCYEEVNFFEEEVYHREESLQELYIQNLDKKVTQLKAKLDMGTLKSMLDKQKKEAAAAAAPAADAAGPPPAPPPPPPALPADSPPTAEGAAPPPEGESGTDAAASPPATGETAAPPATSSQSPAEGDAAAMAVTASDAYGGEELKLAEGTTVEEGLTEPRKLLPFEPLLFCPKKSCEVEGCVKVVHRYCWLRWGRFRKVDWTLPNIVQVNNCFPLASTCL
ncbi:hypothetical protein R1flu_024511 [Riccia fluitans]|uniref:SWIM-type domain-containing protein n=1 Tax=Riccia fluitans TaxID=41844 RepID=A0ABD1XV50_9MARC